MRLRSLGASVGLCLLVASVHPASAETVEAIAFTKTFTCGGLTTRAIFVVRPDLQSERQITFPPCGSGDVIGELSPDGTKVQFSSNRRSGSSVDLDILVRDLLTGDVVNLTPVSTNEDSGTWSPDGLQIAFASQRNGLVDVWRVASALKPSGDPPDAFRVTLSGTGNILPHWHPFGDRIAFQSFQGSPPQSIREVFVASGLERNLIDRFSLTEREPAYSSDGTRIAWSHFLNSDSSRQIYVGDLDNGDVVNRMAVTSGGFRDSRPSWSPDGTRIVFSSDRDGGLFDLFVVELASGTVSQLTSGGAVGTPRWGRIERNVLVTALPASKDSFLRKGNPHRNEGANPGLRVRASGNNRAVVGFDQTAIDGFVNTNGLTSATLVLNIAENGNNWGGEGRTVDAHPLLVGFAEGDGQNAGVPGSQSTRGSGEGVTWRCAVDAEIANKKPDCDPQWGGGSFGPATADPVLHSNGQLGEVTWDVTDDVLAGSSAWLVKKTEEGPSGKALYTSREGAAEAGDPDLAPRLLLE